MLGNLMDDAYKSARSRVCLSGSRSGTHLWFAVEDDGPGIAQHDREEVLLRGRRLDETTAGAGLGFAIVCDLAELYRGSLELTGLGSRRPARHPRAAGHRTDGWVRPGNRGSNAGRSVRRSPCRPPG